MMCWHKHDFENDPGYRATGIPPAEIACPVCGGEGGLMFAPGDWGCKMALVPFAPGALCVKAVSAAAEKRARKQYLKEFTEDGHCRHCNGRGLVENTEKIGTTYVKLSPV
jgi:hypothetical protein